MEVSRYPTRCGGRDGGRGADGGGIQEGVTQTESVTGRVNPNRGKFDLMELF